jgi:chaperonin cofactor prefoldin
MNQNDDTSRFTLRDRDEATESIYIADAENLRVEKLSTRVTLVAVLIPCLLVIVLAIAYLDIKNRVVSTQNTGSMGVQKLSKDLESRFSNLSLKQAKIEQQLSENSKTLETATAALQINLKKATTELKRATDSKPDQSALTAMSKKTEAAIAALQSDMSELNTAFSKFDEELAGQILLMAQGLKKDKGRLAEIKNNVQRLESEKLSKESMDLALGLERLALKEMVKDKIRGIEKKLATLNKQIDTLNQRLDAQARKASQPAPTAAAPRPSAPPPVPSDAPTRSTNITEQTID